MQALSAGRLAPITDCNRYQQMVKYLSVLVAFGLLSVGQTWAIEGNAVRPYLELGMGYDSNLFHFAGDSEAVLGLGEPIRSVTYSRYGVGADLAWKPGRQQLSARLGANKTSFSRYEDRLDYDGKNLSGEWRWQLGNRWSGLISSSLNRSQSTPTISGIAESNVSDTRRKAFMAEYWLHPSWRARLRFDQIDQQYSTINQSISDNQSDSTSFGVYFQGGAWENIGIDLFDSRSEFPNRPLNTSLDNRSNKQSLRVSGNFAYSGKSTLAGSIGYARSTHPTLINHDFNGLEGRFSGRWLFTGKSLLEVSYRHELRESGTLIANYETGDNLSLAAVWQIQPKTRLTARASSEHIDFEGDVRKDRLQTIGLSASYEIWRGGDISINLQRAQRNSSDAAQEYASNTLFVSTNLLF